MTVKGVNALRAAQVVVVPVMDTGERGTRRGDRAALRGRREGRTGRVRAERAHRPGPARGRVGRGRGAGRRSAAGARQRRLRHHRRSQRVLDLHLSRADRRRPRAGHRRGDRAGHHRHAGPRGSVGCRADRGHRAADAGAGHRGGRRAQGRVERAGHGRRLQVRPAGGRGRRGAAGDRTAGRRRVGSALGLPEESVRAAAELDGEPLPYLSTLIAPARREGGRGGKFEPGFVTPPRPPPAR